MHEKIRFENHIQKSTFHNPLLGSELDSQELEIRRDPLTRRQSIFNPNLQDKMAVFFGKSDPVLIEQIARESRSKCFLCGDRWKLMTPMYPDDMVPGGRVQLGETVLFPNLFPISQVHAVIRVGARHYLPLEDFSPPLIEEALRVSRQFAGIVSSADSTVRFWTVNGNYLGPAGSSIVHPHFQMLGGDVACTHMEELLALSGDYFRQYGTCYWADLADMERELRDRFIAQTGNVAWITSFSPQGTNEVQGILVGKRNLLELDDSDLVDLSEGFSATLRGYASMGLSTFNFSLYSGPLGTHDDTFCCFLRIISRQNVYENYRTDDYFLQKLLRNELILNTPEHLASLLRTSFPEIAGTAKGA